LSSAEDTSAVTVTPSARADSSPDGPVPVSAEAVPDGVSPPPTDTRDETGERESPAGLTKPLPQLNAVAREVRVRVTGARPGGDGGERDLFSETTTTVLIFEKGGVIRLTAAVAPGQLLFLTNEDSQKEVVTQVMRKRAFRPTECYVELEFTEPAPQFWGVEFSAASSLLPKDEQEVEAAELVASAETSTDDPGDTTPVPNAEEVSALKREVDTLRGQLQLLQKANTPEPAAPVEEAKPPASEPALVENWEAPPTPEAMLTPSSEAPVAVSAVPTAASEAPLHPPFLAKPSPSDSASPPPKGLATEELPLPKPQFDFTSSLPKRKKRSFRARGNFTPGFRTGMLRMTLPLMALLGTIVGAAWYKGWLPWKPAAKQIEVASWTGSTTMPSAVQAAPPAASLGSPAPEEVRSAKASRSANGPESNAAHAITVHENLPEPEVAKKVPESTEPSASRGESRPGGRLPAHPPEVPPSIAPSALPEDATIVPPKLIRSVKAVASLDDLRDFETGSVIIEAVVDTSGEVISMNVLSGPPSLRKPAMDALKNYKYESATRNGTPVPARVSVKIQFHFE